MSDTSKVPFLKQPGAKSIDIYAVILSWLDNPHLTPKELKHRRMLLNLRLLMLNKLDEDYYVKKYIKLRTR